MLSTVLLVAALIFFILATVNMPVPRINLVAAGLACWMAAKLFTPILR